MSGKWLVWANDGHGGWRVADEGTQLYATYEAACRNDRTERLNLRCAFSLALPEGEVPQ